MKQGNQPRKDRNRKENEHDYDKCKREKEHLEEENKLLRALLSQERYGTPDNFSDIERLLGEKRLKIQQNREILAEADKLEWLEEHIPFVVLDPNRIPKNSILTAGEEETGKFNGTLVGVALTFRDDRIEYQTHVRHGYYPGPVDEAVRTLLPYIVFLLAPVPGPEDIREKKTGLEGLTGEDIKYILEQLVPIYKDKPKYFQKRAEIFRQRLWPKWDTPEYTFTYDEAYQRYYKWLDDCFEAMEKRFSTYRLNNTSSS